MNWIEKRLKTVGPNQDAHNERIKLLALSFNAVGLAVLIGGVFAPLFDPARGFNAIAALLAAAIWFVCLLAAFEVLRYIQAKD